MKEKKLLISAYKELDNVSVNWECVKDDLTKFLTANEK